jgi:hypothetical protein
MPIPYRLRIAALKGLTSSVQIHRIALLQTQHIHQWVTSAFGGHSLKNPNILLLCKIIDMWAYLDPQPLPD